MWTQRSNGQVMSLTMKDLVTFHPHNEKPLHGMNNIRRYYCPIHFSDNQRSFRLNMNTGHFKCYNCGAWGYIDEINKNLFKAQKQFPAPQTYYSKRSNIRTINIKAVHKELHENFMNKAGIGVRYLESRGIPHELGLKYQLGYACWGKWPQYNKEGKLARQWNKGRLVFPHTDPRGNVINLYGRAIEFNDEAPKSVRHDHLNMPKGCFNAPGLRQKEVVLTEGSFDAISYLSAGINASAIFGIAGFNINWVQSEHIYMSFDDDEAGQQAWTHIGFPLLQRGKRVYRVLPETYQGYNDPNEVWMHTKNIKLHVTEVRLSNIDKIGV